MASHLTYSYTMCHYSILLILLCGFHVNNIISNFMRSVNASNHLTGIYPQAEAPFIAILTVYAHLIQKPWSL